MPETVAYRPAPRCSPLLLGSQIEEPQPLGPDSSVAPERDARGRFAKGSSGNRGGRPRGIPNPERRVPDLVARPVSPETLLALLDRKPHLLRPLVEQLWPPPLTAPDPAARLGIDLSSLRSVEDSRQLLPIALTGILPAARSRPPKASASPGGEYSVARRPAPRTISGGGWRVRS